MFKIIKLALICGPRILCSYFAWMRKYAKNPTKYPLQERYDKARYLIMYVLKKMRLDLDIKNYEYLRDLKQKTLIISNHQSMIDIMLLISLSAQPITFVAKDTVFKMPFVGKILKGLEGEFLVRDDPRQSIQVLRRISEKIKSGYCHVCIYPEGHRNTNPFGELLDFHPGSFKPAYWNESPILLFSEFGTFRVIQKDLKYKRYPVFVNFLKIENYEDYKDITTTDYAPKARELIYTQIKEDIDQDKNFFAANNENKKLTNNEQWWVKYGIN